jgi:two-component system invasion response regulator UvrY
VISILIVDDHPVVRQGLKQILAEEFPSATFGEAQNASEALDLVNRHLWNIVILDISLPGKSGLELLKELKQKKATLPVLVLTMLTEEQLAVRVLKAGADGYLKKDNAPDELVRAIKIVLAGGKYVNPTLAQALTFDLAVDTGRPLHASLSDREYHVLCMIASGKTAREIAGDLCLSVKTINTFRGRILKKLDKRTNVELTRYAIENRLVDART